MKHYRFAAHYIFIPNHGYLKQYGVELVEGDVVRIFPLVEEVEDTEWLPGVIALFEPTDSQVWDMIPVFLDSIPCVFRNSLPEMHAYHLFPFDFISMCPVSGTRRRRLP